MVLSMERWKGKVAVVTGASSGIGATIAKQLVQHGLLVVGIARRKERVEVMAKMLEGKPGKLFAFKADISKIEEIKAAFEWITKTVGPVSILVNNAGVHFRNTLIDGDIETWRRTIDVNLLGLCVATREAISIMRKNNIDGHIIHINSICGHFACNLPNMDVYPATKYGVTALTETLRREINELKLKIKVTSVSPGVVDTEIFDTMENKEAFKQNTPMLDTADIADGVIYAISTPPHVQIHELTIRPVGERI